MRTGILSGFFILAMTAERIAFAMGIQVSPMDKDVFWFYIILFFVLILLDMMDAVGRYKK